MNRQKKSESTPFQSQPQPSAFTMIELLVVMLVITILLTIGVPAIMQYRTQGKINACQVTVNIIDTAIGMYHGQHNKYPGENSITSDLIGLRYDDDDGLEVDDFQPGVGYRLQRRGPIYGPWNGVDKLKHGGGTFYDAFGQSIWYSVLNAEPDDDNSTYEDDDDFDNENSEDGVNINNINDYATNKDDGLYRRDYILMSPSADGKWGLIRGTDDSNIEPTDDVTNFTR
jgi:prepilin-type N-terminal cleavage/methylation domain-containing protein